MPRGLNPVLLALLACGSALLFCARALAADAAQCIAPISYLALDTAVAGANDKGVAVLGGYERVSPDGRYILRSYSGGRLGQVSLIELPPPTGGPLRAYPTPLSNEAFPVQGSWRYLVDVTGQHYRFSDVLEQGRAARPLFKGGMTGFYAVAAEMSAPIDPGGDADPDIYIRSLSWPQGADSSDQGTGPLTLQTLRIRDDGSSARIVAATDVQFICGSRVATDGGAFALPMLSVDGTEFSAVPQAPAQGQPSMRVYGLAPEPLAENHPCDLRLDLQHTVSKSVFGFAGDAVSPANWITYSDVGSVYVYDRQLQRSFRLGRAREHVLASAFPGLTRDGRVIFAATWYDCADKTACPQQAGYVVVDPYQSSEYRRYWQALNAPPPKACITLDEVLHGREDAEQRSNGDLR